MSGFYRTTVIYGFFLCWYVLSLLNIYVNFNIENVLILHDVYYLLLLVSIIILLE